MKVKVTIEVELCPMLINPENDDERMWVENEIFVGNRQLILHSNDIGDFIGEVTKAGRLTWLDEKKKAEK